MDDRGFIFTVDATLALIVVMVITVSITAYTLIPFYQGEDHQHLEALADSALAVMEQDGTLTNAAIQAQKDGNSIAAQNIVQDRLNTLIPAGVSYKLMMTVNSSLDVPVENDSSGSSISTDQVTKVKVISAPKEGWYGRAWYKIENFTFVQQPQNVATTLWNFHNWLTNFNPWGNDGGLQNDYYWGDSIITTNTYDKKGHVNGTITTQTPVNINFSVPTGTFNSAEFLVGSDSYSSGNSYGANLTINGHLIHYDPNQATFIGSRSNDNTQWMWNYLGNIATTPTNYLISGAVNSFNVAFTNTTTSHEYDLPWFSIIGNYTTSFLVPQGILSSTYYFPDAAGLAVPTAKNLDGKGGTEYALNYSLSSGTVTPINTPRSITWANFYNKGNPSNGYDDETPFVMTSTPINENFNAISTTTDVNIPAGNSVLDSFVAVNAYGGMDGALVEVWNGTAWRTVFNSFDVGGVDYTGESDGYGNTPGIIYIPSGYLLPGQNNKVRITTWDEAGGGDYDLVGLTDCYVTAMYTGLNVRWDDTPFDSYQQTSNTQTKTKSFNIGADAKEAYLFVSTGLDSQNIAVEYDKTHVLYNGSIPYYLDLASLDASKGFHRITTATSTADNYNLTPGTYNLTVIITSYKDGWESGDSDAELFSGTRIGVIYPQLLYNAWATAYSNNVTDAEQKAKDQLHAQTGVDESKMSADALYTGGMPNQIPVRLDLWK